METKAVKRLLVLAGMSFLLAMMNGCSFLGVAKSSPARGGDYYPICLVEADRALDEARMAGKDKQCPTEFNALKDMIDQAYRVHLACNTAGACEMAEEAIAKIRALCPGGPEGSAAVPMGGRYKYCITLHTEFDICKAEIRPEYQADMAKVGDFMKRFPDTTAVIEGHTDNAPITGATCKYHDNMTLSQARAESAVNYLVEHFGIDRSRLTAKGYGDTRPVADNATNAGRQENRRIEAIIDCALMPQQIRPEERLCMTLAIQFDPDQAVIKPMYAGEVAKLGDFMRKFPTTTATIEGHTDNTGDFENNMRLSRERAQSVVDYLVEKFGIDRSRLTAKGYGSTKPIAYDNTPQGRQLNRRIEAIVDCVVKR